MSYWYNKKKEITIGIRELFQKIEQIKIKNSKTIANKIKYRLYYSNKKIKEKRIELKIIEILRERERERELTFKPITKKNLVLFVISKWYIKYRNVGDGLYYRKYNSS